MQKKISLTVLLVMMLLSAGCTTVKIPKYVVDKNPYKKTFFSSYEETVEATKNALNNSGWKVTDVEDPGVYEQGRSSDGQKQVLFFTQTHQTAMFLFTHYSSLNVYVKDMTNSAEVEVRYLSLTPFLLKTFESHKNDRLVNQIFSGISRGLGSEKP